MFILTKQSFVLMQNLMDFLLQFTEQDTTFTSKDTSEHAYNLICTHMVAQSQLCMSNYVRMYKLYL